MSNNGTMVIDGLTVEIGDEKNLLELIRKAGIELPTLCYASELSIHGACRMCMVENERGGLDAACSEPPRAGMEIRTNTERLRKYRKNILELLLANHCRDCTACGNSGHCKLQDLAIRFNIDRVRFVNTAPDPKPDNSSLCITKDENKCILCGNCVRMCSEIQDVGAIDFAFRGSKMKVTTAFNIPIGESNCIGCGQCATVCPTGAIVVRDNTEAVWRELGDKNAEVTVQIAPAVRVAIGKEFGLKEGENSMGLIVAALRRIGFHKIFDTSTAADLTVLEESRELQNRLKEKHDFPLFTSCCPAWVNHCEKRYPELMVNVSTCRSPMQMFASVIKEQYCNSSKRQVHVAVMPCTAKKFEAARNEFKTDEQPNVNYVLTTQEVIRMIKGAGLIVSNLEVEAVDSPFGLMTGSGVIFGVTGGVTEAVLRDISSDRSNSGLNKIAFIGVRGMTGVKEAQVTVGEREVKIAVVSGLGNADRVIEALKSGCKKYDFVEIMACPGGCVCGAGQPCIPAELKIARAKGLYSVDKLTSIKRSEENPLVELLYNGLLKNKSHQLLHVSYTGAGKENHV